MDLMRPLKTSVAVAILCIAIATAQCPSSCSCQATHVNCSNLGLTSVPDGIAQETTHLYLSHNRIDELEDSDFETLSALTHLDLSHNIITDIEVGAFIQSSDLSKLFLSYNQLAKVKTGTFDLGQLTELDLSHNKLRDLEERLFLVAQNLNILLLSHNSLTWNDFQAPGLLPTLLQLDMSYNPLDRLPYLMLQYNMGLEFLHLQNSDVTYIDANAFVGLRNLDSLWLEDNLIVDIKREMFQPLDDVGEIFIEGNPLECHCPLQQFKDWYTFNAVGIMGNPSCKDLDTGQIFDIKDDNLENYCWENNTHVPPPANCTGATMEVNLERHPSGSGMLLSWRGSSPYMDNDTSVLLSCRYLGDDKPEWTEVYDYLYGSVDIEVSQEVTSSCCAAIVGCPATTCTDHVVMGTTAGSSDTAMAVGISIAVMLVITIGAVILTYWFVSRHYQVQGYSAQDSPSNNSQNTARDGKDYIKSRPPEPLPRDSRMSEDGNYAVIDPYGYGKYYTIKEGNITDMTDSDQERKDSRPWSQPIGDDSQNPPSMAPGANNQHLPTSQTIPSQYLHQEQPQQSGSATPDLPNKKKVRRFTKPVNIVHRSASKAGRTDNTKTWYGRQWKGQHQKNPLTGTQSGIPMWSTIAARSHDELSQPPQQDHQMGASAPDILEYPVSSKQSFTPLSYQLAESMQGQTLPSKLEMKEKPGVPPLSPTYLEPASPDKSMPYSGNKKASQSSNLQTKATPGQQQQPPVAQQQKEEQQQLSQQQLLQQHNLPHPHKATMHTHGYPESPQTMSSTLPTQSSKSVPLGQQKPVTGSASSHPYEEVASPNWL